MKAKEEPLAHRAIIEEDPDDNIARPMNEETGPILMTLLKTRQRPLTALNNNKKLILMSLLQI